MPFLRVLANALVLPLRRDCSTITSKLSKAIARSAASRGRQGGDAMKARIRSMGRWITVDVTAEQAAEFKRKNIKYASAKAAAARRARAAIQKFKPGHDTSAALEAISDRIILEDSNTRLFRLLLLTGNAPAELFWSALLDTWCNCDETWCEQPMLLPIMRKHGIPSRDILGAEARSFFDALSDPVRVWRGCSRSRVEGISWTIDRKIADGFAHGHRFIPVLEPVVAEASINKNAVFFAVVDRKESEVVLDPAHLRDVQVTPWEGKHVWGTESCP
jgi:hypothetical protein